MNEQKYFLYKSLKFLSLLKSLWQLRRNNQKSYLCVQQISLCKHPDQWEHCKWWAASTSLEEERNAKICTGYHLSEISVLVLSLTLSGNPPAKALSGNPQGLWCKIIASVHKKPGHRPGNGPYSTCLFLFGLWCHI